MVKANSEGQPGPQDYKRTHADGANMLADAVAPHGGIVMWRAFVYSNEVPTDRVRQAYDEFKPLDGQFRDNVFVQVKNGALDFQPREPFHPLFGAMPKTPLMMEFQITKEYLGQDTHLVYLAPLFKEVLDADTYAKGKGSTVGKVIDGSLQHQARTGITGVSNIGDDRNWTGSQFNQANWYAFGRLAWDHDADLAGDRRRMDSHDVHQRSRRRRVDSQHDADVARSGGELHDAARSRAHHGDRTSLRPGSVGQQAGRPDWSPTYYHRADTLGIGFDRTRDGQQRRRRSTFRRCGALFRRRDARLGAAVVPSRPLGSAHEERRTLWDELVAHYYAGVDSVRSMRRTWDSVKGSIDARRFADVQGFLTIQEKEAMWWRDAALSVLPDVLAPADSVHTRAAGASVVVLHGAPVPAGPQQAALPGNLLI